MIRHPPALVMSNDDDQPLITQLRPPATYELVVDQLRRALALGRFLPGEKLPPERDLAQQLGVSRTSVREAIRILEGEGVLEVRRGASGGPLVRRNPVTEPTYDEFRRQAEAYEQIVDFRLANECAATRLAAARRTEQDVRRLEKLIAALDENARLRATPGADDDTQARLASEFGRLDTQLHLAIARASGNHYLMEAVEIARVDMLRAVGSVFSRTFGDVDYRHREIVGAIATGDSENAGDAMAEHIESTRKQLRILVQQRRPAHDDARSPRT